MVVDWFSHSSSSSKDSDGLVCVPLPLLPSFSFFFSTLFFLLFYSFFFQQKAS